MMMQTIIATAGRPNLLERTLGSLGKCQRPCNYAGTIIVENGPPHGARQVVERADSWLACHYVHCPTANKSAALNSVLPLVGDSLVFFADDDVRLAPETLTAYAAAASEAGRGHYFGGPTGVDYERAPSDWVHRHLPLSARGWEPGAEQVRDPTLAFLGFNWAAFAPEITASGGFDVNRGPGATFGGTGQEGEMQARLRRAGCRPKFVPSARVWHYIPAERASEEWVISRAYRHGVSYAMDAEPAVGPLLGCPPWVAVRVAKGLVRRLVAAVLFNPAMALEARTKQSYNRGLMDGFRHRRRPEGA